MLIPVTHIFKTFFFVKHMLNGPSGGQISLLTVVIDVQQLQY